MALTHAQLIFHLDYRDGKLFWRNPTAYQHKAGDLFGGLNLEGYLRGSLLGKHYLQHRLVWMYHHGEMPNGILDHINRDTSDNRIENLRLADDQTNQYNRSSNRRSTSRFKGVHWCKRSKKWIARYRRDGRLVSLGSFSSEICAAESYNAAVSSFHGEFSRPNNINGEL